MKDIEFKEALAQAVNKTQEYTDKLQKAINPMPCKDLPFLYNSLQTVIEAVKANMDTEQKDVAEELSHYIEPVRTVKTVHRGAYKKTKKSDAEGGTCRWDTGFVRTAVLI